MADTLTVQFFGYMAPQLSSHYTTFDDNQNVLIYLNYFEIDNQMLILLSPCPIEYSQQSFIAFSSTIRPRYRISQKLMISIDQFKSIVSFNILLFGDLYLTNKTQSQPFNARNFQTFITPNPLPQINILVVPGVYSIHFDQIYEFLESKLTQKNEQIQPQSKFDFLVYTTNPYRVCNIQYQFDKTTQLIDYFFYLIDNQIYQDINEIQQIFMQDTIKGTLLDFLQGKNQQPSAYFIQSIRKNFNCNAQDTKFYLLQQIKSLNSIHQNADFAKIFCQNCEDENKCTLLSSNIPQIYFAGQSSLFKYPLSVKFMDLVCRTFSQLICQLFLIANAQNATYLINRLANIDRIEEAISCPSFNPQRNYQNLEMLGDVVIKYLTSAMLFEDPKYKTENVLSSARVCLITNKHLSVIYGQLKLNTMNFKINSKKFLNHMMMIINEQEDQKLSQKQQADIYEALCGACYIKNYEFKDLMDFFKLTNFQFKGKIPQFYKGNPLIDFSINSQDRDTDNDYPLKKQIQKRPFSETLKFNQPFEEFIDYLGCPLNNIAEAMTVDQFERLEFFGDAILELLLIVNVHKECEKVYYNQKQQQLCREGKITQKLLLCPGMLHTAKISLLDSGFMGTMAIYHNFHQYARNLSRETQNDIKKALTLLREDQFTDFRRINQYSSQIPKIMSDLWESVAACILVEYGWEMVIKIYGEMYKPYIKYFVDNISLIYDFCQSSGNLKK
uniref:Dicer-like protein n=1 Tax=Paramecium biaurelia TaxID=65126 RepID=W1I9N1_9CILI|nr:Dicer-like protein [Paramecium biaurelia]